MGDTNYRFWLFLPCSTYVLLFLFFVPLSAKGQQEILYFQRLSVAQNLTSQKYNYHIFKDSEGFIWISSSDGLNRFDSRIVKQYLPNLNKRDTLGLADVNIQGKFFEDNDRNLWFSTVEAIHRYDRKNDNFQQYYYTTNGHQIKGDYLLLYHDKETENLWVRLNDTIFIYSVNEGLNPIYRETFPNNSKRYKCHVTSINDSLEKFLFIPLTDGLQVRKFLKNTEVSKKDYPEKKSQGFAIHALHFENENQLWAGADTGLVVLDLESGDTKIFNDFNGLPISKIKGIVPYGTNILVIATAEKGIFYFNKVSAQFTHQVFTNEADRLTAFQHPIDEIYLSSDNTLWVSSPGKGIYYSNLEKRKFNTYLQNTNNQQSSLNNIKSITEDFQGQLWCLTSEKITVLDSKKSIVGNSGKYSGLGINFKEDIPSYIYCSPSEEIWVGTNRNLYFLLPEATHFNKLQYDDLSEVPWFTFIYQLPGNDSHLFVSTQTNGILEIEGGRDKSYFISSFSDSIGGYTLIFEDSNENLFTWQNPNKLQILRKEYGRLSIDTTIIIATQAYGFIEDKSDKGLWIATANGLFNLNKKNDNYFLQRDTILDIPTLYGMLQDSTGNLWISTNRGLVKYKPGKNPEIRNYSIADGLQSLEFNFWSALKLRNGDFAFGGVNGINIFNPYEIKDIETLARPTITEIKINGEFPRNKLKCELTGALNISEIQKLTFKSKENSLGIRLAALEYSDPSSNQFRYRLKGKNDDWIHNGTDHLINLSFLSPGYYTLEIDASNSDGQWSENPHKLQIRIKPPWYFSIYAILFYILATIAILYAYYRYRIALIRKEAAYKQMIAETETAVLRLQMNPHFIFNSMNSISGYILTKDIDTANAYLGRFAKLMRMILDFAAKPLIDVTDEVELLTLYLQTEAMRFEGRFDYVVDFEGDFDPDEFLIPPMVLQPFVENAILHGFTGKKEKGMIRINFRVESNSLLCSVEDNGIGREAAARINLKAKSHESKALSITERRMELLERKDGVVSSIEFIDLHDENTAPAGTRVILRFPIL